MTPTRETIQAWLVSRISEELGIEPDDIDIREPFSTYGLSSIQAVGLSGELEEWLDRKLSPVLAYDYPSVESLAEHLVGETVEVPDTIPMSVEIGDGADTASVAIIGVACRFPGAGNPDEYWQLLVDGVDAITEVPAERWDLDAFYDSDSTAPGKMNTRWGGFLNDVDQFDPLFFGISPREAARMDPQQRLLLELAWEALEDAGQVPEHLAATRAGVFIGISTNEYSQLQLSHPDLIDAYAGTGNALSVAANRLSYTFDFQGPSVAIDTACSSSLVAVHLACQSIRRGESSIALAGGVSLILSPAVTINFTKAGAMAPDGRCKTFDAGANGYVRSEGAGIVILKPLSEALADGDPIYAVIRGSAVNQDGRTNGLMAPSGEGQQAVLRVAYRQAGVSPGAVQYVETHGTGTFLGDPIETKALGAVLATDRPPGSVCAIGSVKSNMGHLEAAAGVAGLIKVALSLKHGVIPPSLHFNEPNPLIPFDELPLRVQRHAEAWPEHTGPALAGVSSFGFGGTNAHVVLEAAPQIAETHQSGRESVTSRAQLLPLSARSPEALLSVAKAYQEVLIGAESTSVGSIADISYTASLRRSHHDYRLALVGNSREELHSQLEDIVHDATSLRTRNGHAANQNSRKLIFVFSGQGSQWFSMGRELYEQETVFREALERCGQAIMRYADWDFLQAFTADEEHQRLAEIDIVQPTLFAIQVALAALWQSWGVKPDAVVGHSMGEVAAAHVAGALSLEDAARVVCHRSRLMKRVSGEGSMIATQLSLEEAQRAIAGYEDRVSVAVSNGPTSTVLSGDPASLEEILQALQLKDVFARHIQVDVAAHSPQMEDLSLELAQSLEGLRPQPADLPIYSTVIGDLRDGLEFDESYWARNLREPVLFWASTQRLLAGGFDSFLEISPHPVLLTPIQQGLHHLDVGGDVLASLRRDEGERTSMLSTLGRLYAMGYAVDWQALYPEAGRMVSLPSYPWQRESYWLDSQETSTNGNLAPRSATLSSGRPVGHPLLGRHLKSAGHTGTHFWETDLEVDLVPYLDDHRVQGVALLPASSYLEAVLAAAKEAYGGERYVLEDVAFKNALVLQEGLNTTLQLVIIPEIPGTASFQFFSRQPADAQPEASWTLHASGKIRLDTADQDAPQAQHMLPDEIQARLSETVLGDEIYSLWDQGGLRYGSTFQGIEQIWRKNGEAVGKVRFSNRVQAESTLYDIHPAFLDACLQVLGTALPIQDAESGDMGIFLPVALDVLRLYDLPRPETDLWSHAFLRPNANGDSHIVEGDVFLIDDDGHLVLEAKGFRLQQLDGRSQRASSATTDWLYEVQWQPQPLQPHDHSSEAHPNGSWVIFADDNGVAETLRHLLEARGEAVVTVSPGEAYGNAEPGQCQLNPANPEDFRQLLAETADSNDAPVRGVVHLWGLDGVSLQETDRDSLETPHKLGVGTVLHTVHALAQTGWNEPPGLWLVTNGAQLVGKGFDGVSVAQSPLWGLRNTIALEHPEFRSAIVDLSPAHPQEEIEALFEELWQNDQRSTSPIEDQIALRGDARYVARLARYIPDDTQVVSVESSQDSKIAVSFGDHPYRLETTAPGQLDALLLRETARQEPGPGEVEIQVHATGLNFLDVLAAMGMRPDLPDGPMQFGAECAGRITAMGEGVKDFEVGDEVLAIAPASFRAYVTTSASLVVPKPAQFSFEEAATIPIAFLTAYVALYDLGRLREGERVLIHAAAGGVGLAAVQLARQMGAEIFATAGSPEKREFLQSLGIEHVMDSRSLSFADEVMQVTKGEGVDVILNSLAGEAIGKGLSILRANGRFLEIGKRDIYQNSQLDLGYLRNNVSFFAIDLIPMLAERPGYCGEMLRELVALFEDGSLELSRYEVFSITEVENAFRHMANARHIGKIAVSFQTEEVLVEPATETEVRLRPDGTYLITGGLGGLGLAVAQWMVEQGAQHLLLMGRSDPSAETEETLDVMRQARVQIEVASADVTQQAQVADVLADIDDSMPPLRGVVHAAGILDDGILQQLNLERFQRVMAPKVAGAWNLHTLTLDKPLDFFVLFSSAAAVLGSPGQGNYAAANAFMDALAHHRRAQDQPALSINWGPWAEVGLAARPDRGGRLAFQGFSSIKPDQGVQVFGRLIEGASPQVVVMPIDWGQLRQSHPSSPLLSHLILEEASGSSSAGRVKVEQSAIRQAILAAEPTERQQLLEDHFRQRVAKVLGLPATRLDLHQPLNNVGIDSLMAVELKNHLEVDLGVGVPLALFFQGPSIAQLASHLLDQLDTAELSQTGSPVSMVANAHDERAEAEELLANIDQLSDEEVDALLKKMSATGEGSRDG